MNAMDKRRTLIDLPPLNLLVKYRKENGCYLADITELFKTDKDNLTYIYHMQHALDTDSYIVKLEPHENNKYQIWNTYGDCDKYYNEKKKRI